jgi:hypothetical protein
MNPKRVSNLPNVPWVTASGTLDPAKFPIEVPIRQCLNPGSEEFRHGCRFLGSMASHGRLDAGIFLLGLLRYHEDDVAVITTVVESLRDFPDARCANALFAELRRVPSSNRTRAYLDTVIGTLTRLPADLVQQRFWELSKDSYFSYRMRAKFATAAEDVASHR